MRWHCHRRQHLRRANVRAAKHSHSAIRLFQLRSPLHGVVTIRAFVAKRIKLSARIESPARVLYDDDVTMGCECVGLLSLAGSVIRRTLEQNRKSLFTYRSIDVRHERYVIAHLCAHTVLNLDPVESLRVVFYKDDQNDE